MSIVTQEQLAEATGFEPSQTARIEKCLAQQGIVVFHGRNRIWTTTEIIAKAAEQAISSNDPHIKLD